MAKIKAVRHGRTKNTGNYETARSDVEVDLDQGDTVQGAIELARILVAFDLGDLLAPEVRRRITGLVEAGKLNPAGIQRLLA